MIHMQQLLYSSIKDAPLSKSIPMMFYFKKNMPGGRVHSTCMGKRRDLALGIKNKKKLTKTRPTLSTRLSRSGFARGYNSPTIPTVPTNFKHRSPSRDKVCHLKKEEM